MGLRDVPYYIEIGINMITKAGISHACIKLMAYAPIMDKINLVRDKYKDQREVAGFHR